MTDVDPNLAAHVAQLKPGQRVVVERTDKCRMEGVAYSFDGEEVLRLAEDAPVVRSPGLHLRGEEGKPAHYIARILSPAYVPDPQPDPSTRVADGIFATLVDGPLPGAPDFQSADESPSLRPVDVSAGDQIVVCWKNHPPSIGTAFAEPGGGLALREDDGTEHYPLDCGRTWDDSIDEVVWHQPTQPAPTGPTLPTEEEWAAEKGKRRGDRRLLWLRGWIDARDFITERTRGGVLIGPQSAEDVDRLNSVFWEAYEPTLMGEDGSDRFDGIRAVLHALGIPTEQAPTQPDEPTGAGSVVRDAEGDTWVRTENPTYPWCSNIGGFVAWGGITPLGPVTVLHEGWSE